MVRVFSGPVLPKGFTHEKVLEWMVPAEIEKLLPYASNWQIKEPVWYGEKKTPIDLPRLKAMIDKAG
jgi:hypothetical protein